MATNLNRNDLCPCGSRLKYKKCHWLLNHQQTSDGAYSNITRFAGSVVGKQIHVHNYGPQIQFSQIIEACNGYNIFQSLSVIRGLSSRLMDNDDRAPDLYIGVPPTMVTQPSLATVARCILLGGSISAKRQFTVNDCASLLRLYHRLQEPLAIDSMSDQSLIEKEIELHLSRAFFLESPWQKERRHVLPRSLLIFKLLEQSNTSRPITKYLTERLGMDVYDWMLLAMLIWSWNRSHSGRFSFEEFAEAVENQPKIQTVIDSSKIKRFLNHMSASRERYCELARRWESDELQRAGLGKYSFNPLCKYPLIRLDETKIISGRSVTHIEPMEWLLLEAASYGNYFLLAEKSGGSLGKSFGNLFELYVGKLLRGCLPSATGIYEEEGYSLNGSPYRSADWTVVEGESATLIECKAANIRMSGKIGLGYVDFAEEMDELVKGIEQSSRFKSHALGHPLRWPHLSKLKEFHQLIVVYDQQYLGNFSMRNAIKTRLSDTERNTIWHVINIDELEYIFEETQKRPLASILSHKAATPEQYEMDFREYMIAVYGRGKDYVNPVLESVWLQYFDADNLLKTTFKK